LRKQNDASNRGYSPANAQLALISHSSGRFRAQPRAFSRFLYKPLVKKTEEWMEKRERFDNPAGNAWSRLLSLNQNTG